METPPHMAMNHSLNILTPHPKGGSMKTICKNCFDYDPDKEECTIRFIINKELSTRKPMKKAPEAKGCLGFMFKSIIED